MNNLTLFIKKKIIKEIILRAFLGLFLLALGAFGLIVFFGIIRLWGFFGNHHLSDSIYILISLLCTALLFWASRRVSREYLSDLHFTTETASDEVIVIDGMGTNINPLAPDSMHSFVKVIVSILLFFPKLCMFGLTYINVVFRLAAVDFDELGRVLYFLYETGEKQPLTILSKEFPDINHEKILREMKYIDGIVFVRKDKFALAINDEFRAEIGAALNEKIKAVKKIHGL